MFSRLTELSMRSMMDLMHSMARREQALIHAYFLDNSLCAELRRLVKAAEASAASVQYSRGLAVLTLWDVKHLYELSAARSTTAAQRASARLAVLSRDEFALAQQSPRTRARVEREFSAYREHGVEPEDLYADGFFDDASDDDDDDAVHTSDVTAYDADEDDEHAQSDDVYGETSRTSASDDVEHRQARSDRGGKLQCFVEWDFLTRAG